MDGLFSTAYLGPISYYSYLVNCTTIHIERWENWQKQTYRNRCYIDGPNGKLMLNIPIKHGDKKNIGELEISYSDSWPAKHWQAIKTTYSTAPFFDVLAPELQELLEKKHSRLFDLNLELTKLILTWLRINTPITLTEDWSAQKNAQTDLRNSFSAKTESQQPFTPYPQVFDYKNGFLPNLSILDLLFNEGPAAYDYLKEHQYK